jgi:hypothetical protein
MEKTQFWLKSKARTGHLITLCCYRFTLRRHKSASFEVKGYQALRIAEEVQSLSERSTKLHYICIAYLVSSKMCFFYSEIRRQFFANFCTKIKNFQRNTCLNNVYSMQFEPDRKPPRVHCSYKMSVAVSRT